MTRLRIALVAVLVALVVGLLVPAAASQVTETPTEEDGIFEDTPAEEETPEAEETPTDEETPTETDTTEAEETPTDEETPTETDTPTETETPVEPTEENASIGFDNQTSDARTVVVNNSTLPEGGFIAIYSVPQMGPPTDVPMGDDSRIRDIFGSVGNETESNATDANATTVTVDNTSVELSNRTLEGATAFLESGTQEDVTVELRRPLTENQTLVAVPHQDTNDNETLDFLTSNGTEDGPYTVDAQVVNDTAFVNTTGPGEGPPEAGPPGADRPGQAEEPTPEEETPEAEPTPAEETTEEITPAGDTDATATATETAEENGFGGIFG
jgi:hypothetical protein